MAFFMIRNTRNANKYFLEGETFSVKRFPNVVQAENISEVIKMNNVYSDGKGNLKSGDIAEITGNARIELERIISNEQC